VILNHYFADPTITLRNSLLDYNISRFIWLACSKFNNIYYIFNYQGSSGSFLLSATGNFQWSERCRRLTAGHQPRANYYGKDPLTLVARSHVHAYAFRKHASFASSDATHWHCITLYNYILGTVGHFVDMNSTHQCLWACLHLFYH